MYSEFLKVLKEDQNTASLENTREVQEQFIRNKHARIMKEWEKTRKLLDLTNRMNRSNNDDEQQ